MVYGARNYAGRSYADGAGITLAGVANTVTQKEFWQVDVNGGLALTASRVGYWQTDLYKYLLATKIVYFQVDENFGSFLVATKVAYFQIDENFGLPTVAAARVGYFQIDEYFVVAGAGGAGTYGGFKYGALQFAQFLVRAVEEVLTTADAATRHIDFTRLVADVASATDAVSSFSVMPRTAEDAATVIDAVLRAIFLFRTADDSAPAEDEVGRIAALFRRVADDAAPAIDDVAFRTVFFYRIADDAPVTGDAVTRQVSLFRGLADTAFANDVVTHQTTQFRIGTEAINAPTDESWAFVFFGPPTPTVAYSGSRIGVVAPTNVVTMDFTFDRQVFAWEVRANSTGPHDGDRIAGWASEPGLETIDHGSVEITAEDLRHGANEIVVYGFTHSGGWSQHPL